MDTPRKLAAILAADIVGYSRLMSLDEAGTAKALREHRAAIDPILAGHGGRVFKTTGDGVLVEFSSIVAAVESALAVQKLMAERNADVPEERRMVFRIGINLGDVLIEGDDVLGDGVNVAARLEGIAEPGGICISDDSYRQVRGKLDVGFEDAGEQQLKNIVRPVRVYRVQFGATAKLQPLRPLPSKPADGQPPDIAERTNNLPQHLSPLIGRESELVEVKELMGTTSLLTLVGASERRDSRWRSPLRWLIVSPQAYGSSSSRRLPIMPSSREPWRRSWA